MTVFEDFWTAVGLVCLAGLFAFVVLAVVNCSAAQLPPGTSATVTGPDGIGVTAHGAWIPNPAPTTYITNNYGCACDAGRD